ncbi:MAG: T9SS type A sorting domain-containing protein, partial [Bacteroidales bacterium]|nr:T9SS type A sorting domain-containing protein [Bacteroidales bacterium]
LLLNKPVAIPAGDNNVGVIYSTVNYPESFEVYYGATQDVDSMTLLGGKYNVTLDGVIYKTLPLNLNVPAGDYYFAIKAVSEADQNYILIDSFYIATGPAPINPDLTITKVIKPQMGCSLTESEKLGVVISNQGTGASSQTVYIRYTVGSVTGIDTVQINILPDDGATYYLNAEFDFSEVGYYDLEMEVTDPDDLNTDNNVYYGSLYNRGVAELPYSNDLYDEDDALEFEWTNDDWVYFNVPYYGYKDITAAVKTPLLTHCFNVPEGITHLSMDLGYMAGFSFSGFEDVDTFMIKVGKQGTDVATWSVVADLEGEQTYGDYTSKHFMFDVADGGGTYQIAIVPVYLSGLAVESISIYATPQHDLTITDIIRPVVVCEVDSTESFGFVLKNLGYDTAMTYQVDYGVYNSELGELNVYTADFNTPIAPGETKTVYTVIAEKLVPSSNTDYYNYGVYGNVELTDDENTGNDITDFLYFGIYTPIATPWVSNLYSSGDDFIGGPDVNDWFYSYYDGAMIAESYELPDPLKTRCIEISEAGHYMIMLGYFAGYEEYGLTADFTVKIGLSGTDIASWQTVATYSDIMSSAYFTVDRLFVNLAATGKYQIAVVPTGFSGEEFFMAVDGMSVVQAKAFDVSLNSAIKPSIDCEPGVEEFTVNLINMGYDTLKTLPLYVYGYNYKLTDYLPVTETYDTVILKNLNILPGESAGVKVPVDLSMMESVAYLILNLNDTIAYYSPTLVYFTVDDEVINNDLRNYNETYAYLGIFEPETMPFTPDLPNYGQNAEKYFANVMNIYDAEYYGISSDKWILDHYNAFVYVAGLTLPEALKTHCIQIDNPGNYLLEFKYWAGLSYYDITASVDVLIGKTGTDISSWTKLLEIRDEMAEDYNTVYSPLAISEAGLYQIAIVPKSFEGQFYFDFAKLNLTVPAEHNIVLKSVNNPLSAYTPAKQLAGNTAISATVLNLGKSTENVTVSVLKDNVSIADTVISGIEFGEETTVAVSANPAMQAGDNATFSVEASIEAEDLDTTDNINSFAVTATDSVFAKENLLGFDYGLGAEAAISFGNIYTLSVQDTLTSVSILFAEDAEAQEFGYSVYKILANGELAAAPVISGTAESEVGLITMYFSNSEILEPGSYYAGIDQLGAIPAGVAFDTGNSEDVFYVKVGNLLVPVPGWGSLAIRANVGKATLPSTAIEVNNLGKQSKLNVYTQNRELYIAANEGMKNVSLVNVQGVTVMKSGNINSDNYKFNVQNLASGIYFVRVQMGGELKNVKVIIY